MNRPFTLVSASQVSAFQRCQRFWYYGWMEKKKSPPSDAMQRGTDIHSIMEHFLKTGTVGPQRLDHPLDYRPYITALAPYLPAPGHEDLVVEMPVRFSSGENLPTWLGYIDVGYSGTDPLRLYDLKTTSDFRYCKTREELRSDLQLISYAKHLYDELEHDGEIEIGHLYLKTEKKRVPKNPKVNWISVEVDKAHVDSVWERRALPVLRQMQEVALIEDAQDVEPTGAPGECRKYNQLCHHAAYCGVSLNEVSEKRGRVIDMASFADRLKAKKEALAAEGKGKPSNGVLPSDAPSRETPLKRKAAAPIEVVEAEEELEEEEEVVAAAPAKKRGRPAKAKVEVEAEEAELEEEEVALPVKVKSKGAAASGTVASLKAKKPFTLYVDCIPVKGAGEVEPTTFEDWLGPILRELNEYVQQQHKDITDYRLLPFSEEKALFSEALKEKAATLPPSMILSSGTPGAKDAQLFLTAHATQVVRALRG